tara:strand:- start:358 stop:1476 length:1119 start_codon:yes stop_codon:yes gene_type:complete
MVKKRKKRNDAPKILFFVTGIGYGDSTRVHTLILELQKKYPKAKFLIACYDNSYAYFKDKYPTIVTRGYKLTGTKLKFSLPKFILQNIFLPSHWTLGALEVNLKSRNFIPDLIISDFEPTAISLATLLRKKCITVFGFDPRLYKEYKKENLTSYKEIIQAIYYNNVYRQANLTVIPTFLKKRSQHLEQTYINPIIRVQPEDLPDQKTLLKKLKLKKKPILLMLGGSNFGLKLVNYLKEYKKENFIIFGGKLDITNLPKHIKHIRYTPDFLKYLKVCKGIITLGGQKTLSEALIYKKPTLCFPINDHIEQQLNAFALKDLILVSKKHSKKDFNKIFTKFLKELPVLQKKVNNYNLKANGDKQFAKVVEIALND